jgi:hypothetical protein
VHWLLKLSMYCGTTKQSPGRGAACLTSALSRVLPSTLLRAAKAKPAVPYTLLLGSQRDTLAPALSQLACTYAEVVVAVRKLTR